MAVPADPREALRLTRLAPYPNALEFDWSEQWITATDPEGASQIVASNVERGFGTWLMAALAERDRLLAARQDEPSPALHVRIEAIRDAIPSTEVAALAAIGEVLSIIEKEKPCSGSSSAFCSTSATSGEPTTTRPPTDPERTEPMAGPRPDEAPVLQHPGDCPESLSPDHGSGAYGCINAGYSPIGWGGWS